MFAENEKIIPFTPTQMDPTSGNSKSGDHPEFQPIRRIASRVVYSSSWMTLRVDDVALADGSISEYGVVERRPFVLILARRAKQLLLVRQYRYPVNQWTLEFPQGAIEAGESLSEAARRELVEETGCTAQSIIPITVLYEAAGFATHHYHVVEIQIGAIAEARPEVSEEGMSSLWTDLEGIQEFVQSGQMKDAPSLAALAVLLLRDRVRK